MHQSIFFAVFVSFAKLISQVVADSVAFELIGVSVRSEDKFKFDTIGPNNDELLILGSKYPSIGKVTDDGYLKLNNSLFVSVNTMEQYSLTNTSSQAAKGFYIKHGNLLNNASFIAHEQNGSWILYTMPQDKKKDLNISIAAVTSNGSFAPDFPFLNNSKTKSSQSSIYGSKTKNREDMTAKVISVTTSYNSTIPSNGTAPTTTSTTSAFTNTLNVTSSLVSTASVAENNASQGSNLYFLTFLSACGLALIL